MRPVVSNADRTAVVAALRHDLGARPLCSADLAGSGSGLADAARAKGLSGVVHRAVAGVDPTHPALAGLDADRLATFAGGARTLLWMEHLGAAFADAGIRGIVLKGAALLAGVAPDQLDRRPLSDLDLLVARRELPRAAACLSASGFAPDDTVWCGSALEIDLHTDLLGNDLTGRRHGPTRFPEDLLFDSSLPSPVGGPALRLLLPELHLAHAAVHALRHDFRRWMWLRDIALLRPHCEPRRLAEILSTTRSERALACTLAALDELLGSTSAGAPDRRLTWAERAFVRAALRRPCRVHLGEAIAGLGHSGWTARLRWWLELARPAPHLARLRSPSGGGSFRRGLEGAGMLLRGARDVWRLLWP